MYGCMVDRYGRPVFYIILCTCKVNSETVIFFSISILLCFTHFIHNRFNHKLAARHYVHQL